MVVAVLVEALLELRPELLAVLVGAAFMVVRAVLEIPHLLHQAKVVMVEVQLQAHQTTDVVVVAALVLLVELERQPQAALEGLELPHQLADHL